MRRLALCNLDRHQHAALLDPCKDLTTSIDPFHNPPLLRGLRDEGIGRGCPRPDWALSLCAGFLGSVGLGIPILASHFFFVLQLLQIQRGAGAVYTHTYYRSAYAAQSQHPDGTWCHVHMLQGAKPGNGPSVDSEVLTGNHEACDSDVVARHSHAHSRGRSSRRLEGPMWTEMGLGCAQGAGVLLRRSGGHQGRRPARPGLRCHQRHWHCQVHFFCMTLR